MVDDAGMGSSSSTPRSEVNMFDASNAWTIVRQGDSGNSQQGEQKQDAASLSEMEINAALRERGAQVKALPHAVSQLMAMGFDEERVKRALANHGNLPQQALEALFSGNNETDDDDKDNKDKEKEEDDEIVAAAVAASLGLNDRL